jgi:transposase InsO family protein
VSALCEMVGLSRASYYRWIVPRPECPVEMELRDSMQKIALAFPSYGYRRITAEMQRSGFEVNHKHVLRLMREDNLLCLRHKAFVVTTDSRHALPVYPNRNSRGTLLVNGRRGRTSQPKRRVTRLISASRSGASYSSVFLERSEGCSVRATTFPIL